jgi:hypothetical protein
LNCTKIPRDTLVLKIFAVHEYTDLMGLEKLKPNQSWRCRRRQTTIMWPSNKRSVTIEWYSMIDRHSDGEASGLAWGRSKMTQEL